MSSNPATVHVIIPALNEEESLPSLLTRLRSFTENIIVVDNGSTDHTADVSRAHGATVIAEPRRGYGSACLAGLALLDSAPDTDIVAFWDADGSDDPALLPDLIEPIGENRADMVLASRTLVPPEPGALTLSQRLGNRLACAIVSMIWDVRYSDLAPCRALRIDALRRLKMSDTDFGWTVQMQIRAAREGFRIVEIPSQYRRRRFDESKISGKLTAVFRAGVTILRVIAKEALGGKVTER